MRPGASESSKLRGFLDGLDALDGMDVVKVLSGRDRLRRPATVASVDRGQQVAPAGSPARVRCPSVLARRAAALVVRVGGEATSPTGRMLAWPGHLRSEKCSRAGRTRSALRRSFPPTA